MPISTTNQTAHLIQCSYVPQSTLPHTVEINYGCVAAADSPYRVYVSAPPDVTKIRMHGKWIEAMKHRVNVASAFQIDASECDAADLSVELVHDESSTAMPVDVRQSEGVYHVEFTPTKAGYYTTSIFYGGVLLPTGKKVFVAPDVDFSKMKISNLNIGPNYVSQLKEFSVDLSKTGAIIDIDLISITIIDPNGNTVPHKLSLTNVFQIYFTPHYIGFHKIHILYDGEPVPGSPFSVNVVNFCDPSRCKATGSGLEAGTTGELCKFTIDTHEAGLGGLTLAIEGPAETKLKCVDNKDGSCSVEYIPTQPGDYEITVCFASTHIPGSPFGVSVTNPVCPEKVRVFGPALESKGIGAGEPTFFNIDVSDAGPGLISVTINNYNGIPVDNVTVVNRGGGLYTVNFIPPDEESVIVNVKFAHQNVGSRSVAQSRG